MTMPRWFTPSALLLAWLVIGGGSAVHAADTTLADAQALYESAQYEQALEALDGLGAGEGRTVQDQQSVRRYRALCLIALDRLDDAEHPVEEMVRADPTAPIAADVPPRLKALLQQVRQRVARTLAKEGYERGRDAYQRGQLAEARQQLSVAVSLIDDPVLGLSSDPALADLRIVADGFLRLASPAAPPSAQLPSRTPTAPAQPSGPAPASSTAARAAAPGFVPPKAITQPIPRFSPVAGRDATSRGEGEIEVEVGVDGHVTAARMTVPILPGYDALLVDTALKEWRYQPAMRLGVVVPYKVRVHVVLQRP
jgi:hypothetical protein